MKKDSNNTENTGVTNNYNLKSDAVDALANADSEETPEFSQEELQKYRSRKGIHIPDPLKMLFIKAWFSGAVCYFFLWGLGNYISGLIDMLFVLGVALGIVTDLLTNNVIRFLERSSGENDKWLMLPKKGMASFFLNIVYACLILFCVFMLYNLINYVIIAITGNTDTVPLGVEPVLFGLFCMGFDMLFIGIKRLITDMIENARSAVHPHSNIDQDEVE